jgi:glycosyltransferase involved in cell wall biosynthesis
MSWHNLKKVLDKTNERIPPSAQIIIPALNEEEGIGLTIAELKGSLDAAKVLVVDGNSVDRTVEVAKSLGAEIVFQDGTGKRDAIAKAIERIERDTDHVIITDADFTYPAEYVPGMIQILEENPRVGMVCGNRLNNYAEEDTTHNLLYFGNKLLALSHRLLNGVNMQDLLTGLRVVRGEILKKWQVKSKGFDVEVELNSEVERRDFGIVEMPIRYRKRLGEKKLKVSDGATIFKRILLASTHAAFNVA